MKMKQIILLIIFINLLSFSDLFSEELSDTNKLFNKMYVRIDFNLSVFNMKEINEYMTMNNRYGLSDANYLVGFTVGVDLLCNLSYELTGNLISFPMRKESGNYLNDPLEKPKSSIGHIDIKGISTRINYKFLNSDVLDFKLSLAYNYFDYQAEGQESFSLSNSIHSIDIGLVMDYNFSKKYGISMRAGYLKGLNNSEVNVSEKVVGWQPYIPKMKLYGPYISLGLTFREFYKF